MRAARLNVTRRPEKCLSDDKRVIARLFLPGREAHTRTILDRVLGLTDQEVSAILSRVMSDFSARHRDIEAVLEDHYREVARYLDGASALSEPRRLLLGAYFTMEYAFESVALFNPSIVPAPDQSGVPEGAVRFLLSLRATGEGHVSSIVFRTGIVDASGEIEFDPRSRFTRSLKPVRDRPYDKKTFFLKLIEMGAYTQDAGAVLDLLPDRFTFDKLVNAVDEVGRARTRPGPFDETAENVLWLARSNYVLQLPPDLDLSEVVIFPATENESKGIEDARLVRFQDDDGAFVYYGTYTAYNGFRILPQLLETPGFHHLAIMTLQGRYAQNKGLALFPRKLGGWYMMIGRVDGESLYLLTSKNIRFWNDAERLQRPAYSWEFVQIGNCGSPLETPEGWLVLTHGVGPMRRYCIGALLLDLEDPSRVVGHLKEPILMPNADERDGYVPNVVYSCGAMIHGDHLIIPYAMADSAASFATLSVSELLDHLRR